MEFTTLEEITTFISDGSHNPPKGLDSSEYFMLSSKDIETGQISIDKPRYLTGEDFAIENKRTNIQIGDVLLTTVGTIGRTAIYTGIPKKVTFQRSVSVIRPNPSRVRSKYLMYALDSQVDVLNREARGVAQQGIYLNQLRKIKIPFCSLLDQDRIVEVLEDHLSRLDAALEDVKQTNLKVKQFRNSLLKAFTTGEFSFNEINPVTGLPHVWQLKRLGDCLERLRSGKLVERGWSPQCLSHPSQGFNSWGVLKTTAVQMGFYQPEFNKELPKTLEPKAGLEVMQGDFLMTTTGPRNRCGIICHVKSSPDRLMFSGKILRFRVNQDVITPDWLMYLLMSPKYQTILDKLKVGSSDSSVSIGNQQVLDLEIPVPSLSEQLEIKNVIEQQLSQVQSHLALTKNIENLFHVLRRSLLQSAFTGQLANEVVSV